MEVVVVASSCRSKSNTFDFDLLARFHAMAHPKIPPPIIKKSGFFKEGFIYDLHYRPMIPMNSGFSTVNETPFAATTEPNSLRMFEMRM